MNISELIVAFVNQGKTVEMPGIGTLSGSHQPAYMDGAAQTFHAEKNAVTFSNTTSGNNDIVKHLAEVECVDMKVAQQMWKNYIDALTDKLSRTGSHTLSGLGELRFSAGSYLFLSEAGSAPATEDRIVSNVKRYDTECNDPFAVFDAPVEEQPTAVPALDPIPTPAPEPIPEPEPVPEPIPEPEPQPIPEPKSKPQQVSDPVSIYETQPTVETNTTDSESLPPIETASKNDEQSDNQAPETPAEEDIFASIDGTQPSKKKKKRRRGLWIWLLILLLLLLGGGYYYYTNYYQAGEALSLSKTDNTSSAQDRTSEGVVGYEDLTNIFTFNTDLLEYTPEEYENNRDQILRNMQEFWSQFLSSRHYSHAMPYMQQALSEYIGQRLSELLDHEGYSVQRFFTFDDYLHQFFYNELKDSKASKSRATIQSELMDYILLDDLLRQVVEANNLTASDVGKAVVTQPVKQKQVVYTAPMEKSSKKGFDVIAGFYTSKESASIMATRLKGLGCDAYIIDRDHLYYVSMGSAATRTAAEALYRQITSWYNGSVAIQEW